VGVDQDMAPIPVLGEDGRESASACIRMEEQGLMVGAVAN